MMKCVALKDVFAYKDSDQWLYEEVSGKLLTVSPSFISFNKTFVKVFIFIYYYSLCLL